MPKSARTLAYLALALNTIIWGAALPIVKPALEHVSPFHYLFFRYAIASIFSLPVLIFILHRTRPTLKTLLTITLMESLAITSALTFLYYGLSRTSSIEATLIANTAPVLIVLGGIIFLREKEQVNEWIGLILSIIGMLLITFEPIITGRSSLMFSGNLVGNLTVLGHNLSWATYVLLAKKYYKNTSKLLVGFLSPFIGLVSFLILTLITLPTTPTTDILGSLLLPIGNPSILFAAVYMGILGSIIAVPAYIYGNNLIEASEASLFTYLQPLITIPLAVLWLKESLSTPMILALIITAAGVVIAEKRFKSVKNISQKKLQVKST